MSETPRQCLHKVSFTLFGVSLRKRPAMIRAPNATTGMTDDKTPSSEIGYFPQAIKMINGVSVLMDALTINPKRSLEELEDESTTSVELAEALQRQHQVPFRVGHGFASAIVTVARANGFKPKDFPLRKGGRTLRPSDRKI